MRVHKRLRECREGGQPQRPQNPCPESPGLPGASICPGMGDEGGSHPTAPGRRHNSHSLLPSLCSVLSPLGSPLSLPPAAASVTCIPVPCQVYVPTVFEKYTASLQVSGKPVKIHLWDTAGGTRGDRVGSCAPHSPTWVFWGVPHSRSCLGGVSPPRGPHDRGRGGLTHSHPHRCHFHGPRLACNGFLLRLAGQEDYDRLRPLSYSDANVVLMCFDVTDSNSFDNILTKVTPPQGAARPLCPSLGGTCPSRGDVSPHSGTRR